MVLHHSPANYSVDFDSLPAIPRATLTGMRTFIGSEESEKGLANRFVVRSMTIYKIENDLEQSLERDAAHESPTPLEGRTLLP